MSDTQLPATIIDDQFEKLTASIGYVTIIEFWSFRCEQSRHMAPRISRIAALLGEQARVYKSNVDDCPRLTSYFRISVLPTVIVLVNGSETDRFYEDWSDEDLMSAVPK